MKTTIRKYLTTACCFVSLLMFGQTALADGSGKKVSYGDLDLDRPGDVAALYERIQDAARLVCHEDRVPWDGRQVHNYDRCYRTAVELAVRDANNLALASLHDGNGTTVAKR